MGDEMTRLRTWLGGGVALSLGGIAGAASAAGRQAFAEAVGFGSEAAQSARQAGGQAGRGAHCAQAAQQRHRQRHRQVALAQRGGEAGRDWAKGKLD